MPTADAFTYTPRSTYTPPPSTLRQDFTMLKPRILALIGPDATAREDAGLLLMYHMDYSCIHYDGHLRKDILGAWNVAPRVLTDYSALSQPSQALSVSHCNDPAFVSWYGQHHGDADFFDHKTTAQIITLWARYLREARPEHLAMRLVLAINRALNAGMSRIFIDRLETDIEIAYLRNVFPQLSVIRINPPARPNRPADPQHQGRYDRMPADHTITSDPVAATFLTDLITAEKHSHA